MNKAIRDYEEKMWQVFEASKQEMPQLTEAYYGAVKEAVYVPGALDLKTKRLMSLAVAVQAGCTNCMLSQTSKSLDLGASVEEIMETCAVAISMGGTLAWSKAMVVVEYLQERGLMQDDA